MKEKDNANTCKSKWVRERHDADIRRQQDEQVQHHTDAFVDFIVEHIVARMDQEKEKERRID